MKFLTNLSLNMPQLNVSKNKWEKEFSTGRWDYLDSTPAERARSAIIGMLCKYYCPKGKILDVGCGLGTTIDFLNTDQRQKYLGLDISEEAIKKASKKKANFLVSDFNNFKSSRKFDVIMFNEVLYYMDENSAYEQALNILTKNGIILVSLYQMKNKRYDQKIWKASRNFLKSIEAIDISSKVKNQLVTWRVEALKRK
jgi:2-polyprenyl-6-hydroxyphenyl methylase/3-demethylubiquinone-9 3-methyltransferase